MFLAIFHNFRIFSKKRFFDVFGGSWGPGVVLNRPGILKNPGGLSFSSGARFIGFYAKNISFSLIFHGFGLPEIAGDQF